MRKLRFLCNTFLPAVGILRKQNIYIKYPETADKTVRLGNLCNMPLKKLLSISLPHITLFQRVYWASVLKQTMCNLFKQVLLKHDLASSISKYHWYYTCHRQTNNICAWMWSRHCFMEKQHSQDHHKSTWCLWVPDFMFRSWSKLKEVENHKYTLSPLNDFINSLEESHAVFVLENTWNI